jgi:hypothetical protein
VGECSFHYFKLIKYSPHNCTSSYSAFLVPHYGVVSGGRPEASKRNLNFSGRHVASFLDMGIVKWCHPGDHVSMPPFGRYYRKKLVTLDCGLSVGNGVSSSTSHPHLLG